MNTLQIIVSKPCPLAGVDFTEYEDTIHKAITEGHTPIIMQYLHGTLESKMDYDIALCLNGEDCAHVEIEEYITGIYDAKVLGYDNPCKAYLWNTHGRTRALVVDTSNEEDNAFAKSCYTKKTYFL